MSGSLSGVQTRIWQVVASDLAVRIPWVDSQLKIHEDTIELPFITTSKLLRTILQWG